MQASATAPNVNPVSAAGANPAQLLKNLFEDYQEKVGLQLVLSQFSPQPPGRPSTRAIH